MIKKSIGNGPYLHVVCVVLCKYSVHYKKRGRKTKITSYERGICRTTTRLCRINAVFAFG